ncbi:MAG: sensor histidine kinase [Oligoflexus sp.]
MVDNGIGIPQDYLSKVFEMFTQVDPFSTHTRSGLGIGLTLVKRLVQLHNGQIRVESEGLHQGSRFIITKA